MATNYNNFKTSNDAYFPKVSGVPALKLNQSSNVIDDLVDQIAAIDRTVLPADQVDVPPEVLAVVSSPFIYVAGTAPEQIYISGGAAVSAVERWSEEASAWVVITLGLPIAVHLQPSGQLKVTFTGVGPTVVRDLGNFNNAAGITEELEAEASPWVISAAGRAVIVYISGGAINSITRNGVAITTQVPCTVMIPRGGSIVIDYNTAPLVVKDS